MRPCLLLLVILGTATATTASAAEPLTPLGWGDLRIGMRERDAVKRFHLKVARNDGVSSYECREDSWPAHPEVSIMARSGRISRISTDRKGLLTDRGFGVGSREADIVRTYGSALRVEPHAYEGPPAHYLTAWTVKGHNGVRYETNDHGRVSSVHVGDEAIELIESCL